MEETEFKFWIGVRTELEIELTPETTLGEIFERLKELRYDKTAWWMTTEEKRT